MAKIIPLPTDAETLWTVFQRAFADWERNPTPENARRKHLAWQRWAEAFSGRAA